MAHVSKRPSAKELLLDPFLAMEQLELSLLSTTLSTNQTLKINSTEGVANKHLSTYMTITGSINEDDSTLFLKVRISDETGVRHLITHVIFYKFITYD